MEVGAMMPYHIRAENSILKLFRALSGDVTRLVTLSPANPPLFYKFDIASRLLFSG